MDNDISIWCRLTKADFPKPEQSIQSQFFSNLETICFLYQQQNTPPYYWIGYILCYYFSFLIERFASFI